MWFYMATILTIPLKVSIRIYNYTKLAKAYILGFLF